jgi:hypothetical protein
MFVYHPKYLLFYLKLIFHKGLVNIVIIFVLNIICITINDHKSAIDHSNIFRNSNLKNYNFLFILNILLKRCPADRLEVRNISMPLLNISAASSINITC